jgi:UDP-N-acetylglucosamine 2-epimerase (non-hydrolysing)
MTAAKPMQSQAEPIRVMVVAGARPNFMKIAPLMAVMNERPRFAPTLVHTGQHYDAAMSESFFRDLGIPEPDVNLGVGSGTHGVQTGQVLMKIEALLLEERFDAVLVVGDVNSTIAAALAAVKLGVPVAHVEAGLRSGDRAMPEEINRILTDSISDWLFTTEAAADENLRAEGIPAERIHFVGNVMIDTLLGHVDRARELDVASKLDVEPGRFALLTLHRPSNVDDPAALQRLVEVLEEIHRRIPVVFPVHPRTRAAFEGLLGGRRPELQLCEPLGYLDFLCLMDSAAMVLTDSGGIQEETTALGTPCLTLRTSTERPATVSEGTNTIVGVEPERIRAAAFETLDRPPRTASVPPLWDGHAAERIVDVLERDLGG